MNYLVLLSNALLIGVLRTFVSVLANTLHDIYIHMLQTAAVNVFFYILTEK